MTATAGRRIWIVPVVHTRADLGSLADAARPEALVMADRLWDAIEAWARRDAEPLARARRLHLYQDGLPVCPPHWPGESIIVREMASKGSRNHALILRLIDAGGTLWGTESPELLLREYELAKAGRSGDASARHVLIERDRFIGQRINQTLPPDAVGLLFIGAMHDPVGSLAPDIEVIFPLGRPRSAPLAG